MKRFSRYAFAVLALGALCWTVVLGGEGLTNFHPDETRTSYESQSARTSSMFLGFRYWDHELLTSGTGAETLRVVRDVDGSGVTDSVGFSRDIIPISRIHIWTDRFGDGSYDVTDSLFICFVQDTLQSDSIKVKLAPFLIGTDEAGSGRHEFWFDIRCDWAWVRLKNAEGTGMIHAMSYHTR
jgi:hypothetical protein